MAVGKSQSLDAAAVWIAGPDGNPVYPGGGTVGPQPSSGSQSVTPATDSDFARASNQTASGTSSQKVQGSDAPGSTAAGNPLVAGAEATGAAPTQLSAGQIGRIRMSLDRTLLIGVAGNAQNSANYNNSLVMTDAFGVPGPLKVETYGFDPVANQTQSLRTEINGLHVVGKGGSSMATGQVAVATTSTLVVAARARRQKVTLSPTTSTVYYVGNSGASSTTGVFVAAGAAITLDTNAAVYAAGASALTMSYIEFF